MHQPICTNVSLNPAMADKMICRLVEKIDFWKILFRGILPAISVKQFWEETPAPAPNNHKFDWFTPLAESNL